MVSRSPFLLLLFLSVNQAFAFPLPVKHTLQVGNFGGPCVTLPELAFYSVAIVGKRSLSIILLLCSHAFLSLVPLRAAIFVLFVGVYIQSVMTEARASAIFRSLHRTSGHLSILLFLPSHWYPPRLIQAMLSPAYVAFMLSLPSLRPMLMAGWRSCHAVCAGGDLPTQCRHPVPVGILAKAVTRFPSEDLRPR